MTYEDYILRHIRQAGQAWARIVRLIKDRKFAAARIELDQTYRQLLGLSPDDVLSREPNELIARLRFGELPAAGRERCIMLAMLLKASGDVAAQAGAASWTRAYHGALVILLDVALREPDEELPAFAPTIESLDAELPADAVPAATRQLLLRYYEQVGAYGKAEDILWSLLDRAPGDCEVIKAGQALYARLRALGDAALAAGNLPRDEVEGGLAELDAHAREHGCDR